MVARSPTVFGGGCGDCTGGDSRLKGAFGVGLRPMTAWRPSPLTREPPPPWAGPSGGRLAPACLAPSATTEPIQWSFAQRESADGCVCWLSCPLSPDPPDDRWSLFSSRRWLAGRLPGSVVVRLETFVRVEICFAWQAKPASWGSPASPGPLRGRCHTSDVGGNRDTERPYSHPCNTANRTICPTHHTCTTVPITAPCVRGRRALRALRPRSRLDQVSSISR